MSEGIANRRAVVIAAALGALGGGFFVAILTEAIPRMMSQMMSSMMGSMMAQMGAEGCDPAEM